ALQVISDSINNALADAGFGGVVGVGVIGQAIVLQFADSKSATASVPVASNLGFPGLSLQTQGNVNATFNYSFNFTLGHNATNPPNYSIAADGTPLLSVAASISAPDFSADANLGFLHSGATAPSLNAQFAVTASDPDTDGTITKPELGTASFDPTATASASVHLASDMQNAALPSISADLDAGWSLGGAPTLSFDNVSYD